MYSFSLSRKIREPRATITHRLSFYQMRLYSGLTYRYSIRRSCSCTCHIFEGKCARAVKTVYSFLKALVNIRSQKHNRQCNPVFATDDSQCLFITLGMFEASCIELFCCCLIPTFSFKDLKENCERLHRIQVIKFLCTQLLA